MGLIAYLREIPFSHLLSCSCALVIAGLSVHRIRRWYRLKHIPGPRGAAWSVWWQLSGALSGRYHERLGKAAREYGPLVRIGPNELLSTDPEVIRHMAAVRGSYTKGGFYLSGRMTPGIDNVVSERDEVKHKAMRAQIAPGFSGRENEGFSFEAGMDRQLMNFIDLINRKYISMASETRYMDLAEKTQFFALDAIGDISFGKPFGYLSQDEDLYNYNEINASSLPVMNVVSVLPWLTTIVHTWPLRLLLPSEGDRVGFGRLMSFARSYVDSKFDPNAPPTNDMMQAHVNNGMSRDDLIQQVFVAIIAGSNSSSHALRMIILSLITTPTAYAALIAEIRSVVSKVSTPISWTETQSLPYLQAVVREGFRMWPPVGGLGFKRVPAEGDYINGYFVPGGTEIGQGFFGIGRSKLVWGDDADVFRPERWLEAQGEELKNMIAAVDTHFGAGKYSCLGKPIALMELHKATFELMRRYEFAILDAERPIKTQTSVFLFASDLWVRVTKRVL